MVRCVNHMYMYIQYMQSKEAALKILSTREKCYVGVCFRTTIEMAVCYT